MKLVVIGAGVVGAATAYFLGREGAEVTVVDRRTTAGVETSFGLAGLLSPSDANAWASPAALKMAAMSLVNRNSGIQFKLRLDPTLWRWSLEFLRQCNGKAVARNTGHKYRLAEYSMAMLREVEADTGVEFETCNNGILFPCRDKTTLRQSTEFFSLLVCLGLEIEQVDEERALDLVPAFKNRMRPLAGGIYSKNCRTGNASAFSQNILRWCVQNQGCRLEMGTKVAAIVANRDRVVALETNRGPIAADAYILAAGSYSALLSVDVGVRLPIYPVKGFSITAKIIDPSLAPRCGVADENSPVAVSVMGENLRIASSAVFAGHDSSYREADFHQIYRYAEEMLPGVADYANARRWAGFRPMTPSSVPLVGHTRFANLFVNSGHGHLGWTMACGSGRLISDLIFSRDAKIDARPYQPAMN